MNKGATVVAAVVAAGVIATSGAPVHAAPADGKPIKVGVFASLYTATGPSWWSGELVGFQHLMIAEDFKDPKYELYVIIDPGTEKNPILTAELDQRGLTCPMIDGTDVAALRRLDVMVSGNWHLNIYWEVLDAITEAVRQGTCLVNFIHFGLIRPGYETGHLATVATWASHMNADIAANGAEVRKYKERMAELFGIHDAQFVWHLQKTTWRVVTPHPLLGDLNAGDLVTGLGLNGLVGNDPTINLLQCTTDLQDNFDGRTVRASELNPFTVHRLGRGTTINCGLVSKFQNTSLARSKEEFERRCVDWLATQRQQPDVLGDNPEFVAAAKAVREMQNSLLNKNLPVAEVLNLTDIDAIAVIYGKSLSETEQFLKERIEEKRKQATEQQADELVEAEILDIRADTSFAETILKTKNARIEGPVAAVRLSGKDRQTYYFRKVGERWLLLDCNAFALRGFFQLPEQP